MKAQFLTSLSADHLEGKWWQLTSPLAFYSARMEATIVSPKGAVVDFASVPRLPGAYLIAGNTAHWESTLHDVPGYRWGLFSRWDADLLFHEAAVVRAGMRKDQSALHRLGRWARRNLMTGFVIALGWASYKTYPGCLDYREAKKRKCKGIEVHCLGCELFYKYWRACYMEGFYDRWNVLKVHG